MLIVRIFDISNNIGDHAGVKQTHSQKPFDKKLIAYLLIVILAFIIIVISVSFIKLDEMGSEPFFVESILPLPYWAGMAVILCIAFFTLPHLENKRYLVLLIVSSILLLTGYRLAFPAMFNSIPAYEPDSIHYITVIGNWVKNGVDFGFAGQYQHDYPFAFILGYVFIKLGVSTDIFFRVTPFVIYAIDLMLVYLVMTEVMPNNKKLAAVSAFFFSFSSMGYWVTVHYCPDLVGSLIYMLALYLCLKFAKNGKWSLKALVPVFVSVIILILTHHLSTLYFILTLLGLALVTQFFHPLQIKGKAISFFLIGILTYTLWFAYGTLLYPSFFNVYSYFAGGSGGSPAALVQQADLFTNISFAIYPAFILGLFIIEIYRTFQIHFPRDLIHIRSKIYEIRIRESANFSLVFPLGFVLVLGLFFIGFVLPVSFPQRILEVLCIAALPLSTQSFMRFGAKPTSRNRKILMTILILVILLFVLFTGIHRYYSQIQRRVII